MSPDASAPTYSQISLTVSCSVVAERSNALSAVARARWEFPVIYALVDIAVS